MNACSPPFGGMVWLASALCALAFQVPPPAAEIHVTNGTSTIGPGDGCSLSEAILNANGDDQSGSEECGRGIGADVILLETPVVLDAPSALSFDVLGGRAALPSITSDIRIAAGHANQISRAPQTPYFRLFHVHSPRAHLSLSGVRVSGGEIRPEIGPAAGGCILVTLGALTIRDARLSGCVAQARHRTGEDGGGVFFTAGAGPLDLENAEFENCSLIGSAGT